MLPANLPRSASLLLGLCLAFVIGLTCFGGAVPPSLAQRGFTALDPSSVCPGGVAGPTGAVYCSRLYSTGPRLHLPSDPSATARYGEVTRGARSFHTRGGDVTMASNVVAHLGQSQAYARTVYLAQLSAGKVVGVHPVVRVAENAVAGAVFRGRVLEGRIGTWDGQGYTSERMLRLRIELRTTAPRHGQVAGRILNAGHRVRSADGSCLRALSGTGVDPLRGVFTAAVKVQRQPSMHAPFDDEQILVWNSDVSNMGTGFYPSLATVLGGDPLASRWQTFIHGTPTAGPEVDLHFVRGGGGRC